MRREGLCGVVRGRKKRARPSQRMRPRDRWIASNDSSSPPQPDELWIADFTYVAIWMAFIYVAFVIDVYARRIVGWQVSRSMQKVLSGRWHVRFRACSP
jgi:transposase InsO family protein